jgi:dethiobiotin synthase
VRVFPHLNLTEAKRLGELDSPRKGGATWLVLEAYYSMDGDSPNLDEARALCDKNGWNLYLDEAHSVGLFGPEGRGLAAARGMRADVTMLGFGKAVGSAGAAMVGSETVRKWLWNRARSFVFSTAPSPSATRVLLEQLRLTADANETRERVVAEAARLRTALARQGWPVVEGSHGPILSLVLGASELAQELCGELRAHGIRAQAIRPPTVPQGTSRVRLIVSARRSTSELHRLEMVLQELAPRFLQASLEKESNSAFSSEPAARATVSTRPRRILVLGTGTGIGKTYVSECWLRSLRADGKRALGLKPIESGLGETEPGQTDWQKLGRVSLREVRPRFGFQAALSPHLAARNERTEVDVAALLPWVCLLEAELSPDFTLIESAGAVFSPLTDTTVNADALDWFEPTTVVLVAADRLGVLSEVEAALRALHHKCGTETHETTHPKETQAGRRGGAPPYAVPVDVIVLNAPNEPDTSTGLNQTELERVVLRRFVSQTGEPIRVISLARGEENLPTLPT